MLLLKPFVISTCLKKNNRVKIVICLEKKNRDIIFVPFSPPLIGWVAHQPQHDIATLKTYGSLLGPFEIPLQFNWFNIIIWISVESLWIQ